MSGDFPIAMRLVLIAVVVGLVLVIVLYHKVLYGGSTAESSAPAPPADALPMVRSLGETAPTNGPTQIAETPGQTPTSTAGRAPAPPR